MDYQEEDEFYKLVNEAQKHQIDVYTSNSPLIVIFKILYFLLKIADR